MTYTAPGARTFREMKGDLDTKIVGELALIDTEVDGVNTRVNTNIANIELCWKIAVISLTAGNANAIAFSWENPVTGSIIIDKVILNVTTAGGTGGGLLDIGTANDATTGSDNLIDGADANAVAIYDNITDKGTNGKTSAVLATGKFINGQIKAQNAAALVGKVYIIYAKPY